MPTIEIVAVSNRYTKAPKRKADTSEPNNRTGRKSLDRMARDPRVDEIWTEDDGFREDGRPSYWASLAPGFNWDGCSCLHEGTIADLYAALDHVSEGPTY